MDPISEAGTLLQPPHDNSSVGSLLSDLRLEGVFRETAQDCRCIKVETQGVQVPPSSTLTRQEGLGDPAATRQCWGRAVVSGIMSNGCGNGSGSGRTMVVIMHDVFGG